MLGSDEDHHVAELYGLEEHQNAHTEPEPQHQENSHEQENLQEQENSSQLLESTQEAIMQPEPQHHTLSNLAEEHETQNIDTEPLERESDEQIPFFTQQPSQQENEFSSFLATPAPTKQTSAPGLHCGNNSPVDDSIPFASDNEEPSVFDSLIQSDSPLKETEQQEHFPFAPVLTGANDFFLQAKTKEAQMQEPAPAPTPPARTPARTPAREPTSSAHSNTLFSPSILKPATILPIPTPSATVLATPVRSPFTVKVLQPASTPTLPVPVLPITTPLRQTVQPSLPTPTLPRTDSVQHTAPLYRSIEPVPLQLPTEPLQRTAEKPRVLEPRTAPLPSTLEPFPRTVENLSNQTPSRPTQLPFPRPIPCSSAPIPEHPVSPPIPVGPTQFPSQLPQSPASRIPSLPISSTVPTLPIPSDICLSPDNTDIQFHKMPGSCVARFGFGGKLARAVCPCFVSIAPNYI